MLFAAAMEPVSYAVYDVRAGKAAKGKVLRASGNTLENRVYKVTLDANGDIASVIDQTQRPRFGRKRQGLPPCGADPQCVEPLSGMGDPQGDARPDTRTRGYGCPDQRGGVRRPHGPP